MPLYYECQRCTACCRWPGQVRLREGELAALAAYKGMTDYDFIQSFMRLSVNRSELVLQDNSKGECIFLEGGDCSVQPVKPRQCREFPNGWNFPGFEKACQAVARTVSAETYARLTGEHSK
jgi:Fe-S-cluster containining protein